MAASVGQPPKGGCLAASDDHLEADGFAFSSQVVDGQAFVGQGVLEEGVDEGGNGRLAHYSRGLSKILQDDVRSKGSVCGLGE